MIPFLATVGGGIAEGLQKYRQNKIDEQKRRIDEMLANAQVGYTTTQTERIRQLVEPEVRKAGAEAEVAERTVEPLSERPGLENRRLLEDIDLTGAQTNLVRGQESLLRGQTPGMIESTNQKALQDAIHSRILGVQEPALGEQPDIQNRAARADIDLTRANEDAVHEETDTERFNRARDMAERPVDLAIKKQQLAAIQNAQQLSTKSDEELRQLFPTAETGMVLLQQLMSSAVTASQMKGDMEPLIEVVKLAQRLEKIWGINVKKKDNPIMNKSLVPNAPAKITQPMSLNDETMPMDLTIKQFSGIDDSIPAMPTMPRPQQPSLNVPMNIETEPMLPNIPINNFGQPKLDDIPAIPVPPQVPDTLQSLSLPPAGTKYQIFTNLERVMMALADKVAMGGQMTPQEQQLWDIYNESIQGPMHITTKREKELTPDERFRKISANNVINMRAYQSQNPDKWRMAEEIAQQIMQQAGL